MTLSEIAAVGGFVEDRSSVEVRGVFHNFNVSRQQWLRPWAPPRQTTPLLSLGGTADHGPLWGRNHGAATVSNPRRSAIALARSSLSAPRIPTPPSSGVPGSSLCLVARKNRLLASFGRRERRIVGGGRDAAARGGGARSATRRPDRPGTGILAPPKFYYASSFQVFKSRDTVQKGE